ncbi:MAG TPA: threonine ammonia-lyase [Candidatus Stackebrandtia faecavium]|nr:threonine ammonia-lyase [Candidatus Stackebrandtia faecavium]
MIVAMTSLVTVEEIRAARETLAQMARTTPLFRAKGLDPKLGAVHYKCENLQRAGAFKVRGAYVRMSRLSAQQRQAGVVAASAGNHAQGVAVAARELGIRATVFMPTGAPLPKVAATRSYGAEVELVGATVDESLARAKAHAADTGAEFIHPFDHPDVIAGQGTVGLEILEQSPQVKNIVVGVGGGGLVSGIAAAVKATRPDVKVVGVQADGAAAFPSSLRHGRPVGLTDVTTLADGIKVKRPGEVTFTHVDALVDEVVTVSDEDISRAVLLLLERNKILCEPAGAVGVAALQSGAFHPEDDTVVVLSGGNIDPLLLLRIIEHGLAASGRFLRCTVRCPDRPGALASILSLVADRGGNVVDVVHRRHDPSLRVGEVAVALSVETRGEDHAAHLGQALRDAGYALSGWDASAH